MTAAVLYGREDMKIERVDIPSVAEDEVLVRVEVALTCGTDDSTVRASRFAALTTRAFATSRSALASCR